MKYSQESLNIAIYHLLPEHKKAHESGCKFTIPELLKSVSSKFFLEFSTSHNSVVDIRAYKICRLALTDLNEHGEFIFGSVEWNEK